jgi:hypothetical protein
MGARPALPFSQWDSASPRLENLSVLSNGEGEGVTTESGKGTIASAGTARVVWLFNAIEQQQGAPDKADRDEAKRRKLDTMADSKKWRPAAMIEASRAGYVSRETQRPGR